MFFLWDEYLQQMAPGSIFSQWSIHCVPQAEHRVMNSSGDRAALSRGCFLLPSHLHFSVLCGMQTMNLLGQKGVERGIICYAK